ncbi:MAG TPA: zf-HC2 domain-containing protein [Terracidiphilus sp.]|nr:zf-HC2 domain-containing protein [Terracidiphilus sp.]
MRRCDNWQAKFSEYLDGRLSGREMQRIAKHLEHCEECASEWAALRQSQEALSSLGPVPEPKDLLLRIRVAVSQERARSRKRPLEALRVAWHNAIGPFILQAGAGFASAVLLLGTVSLMVGMVAQPEAVQAKGDQPLGNATGPRFLYLSSVAGSSDEINAASGQVVVEAYVNKEGEVYDYRIVSGPTDPATRAEVGNLLLYSVFEPAKFFGQPVRGLAVISFAGISVRG